MNDIETNIYPILNLSDLAFEYDTYRVRNLRREQDEYFQNREALVRDLSFKLGVPVQAIVRGEETFLVVRSDSGPLPDKHPLVRTHVYLEQVVGRTALDFSVRNPENDSICLRFIQFMLQAPLWNDKRLWQPSAGMPFFEKTPSEQDRGIARYRGFGARAVVTPLGGIGLCVDVRSKYVRTSPLPALLDRMNFQRFKGQVSVYHFGHRWYEIRIESLSDLTAGEEVITTDKGTVPLLDFIVERCERPIPGDLAGVQNGAAVIRYRNARREERTAPACLCYPVCDNQEGVARWLHERAIIPPQARREIARSYVDRFLTSLRFKDIAVRVSLDAERVEQKFFRVPDLEFGYGRKLSLRGTPGASHISLDNLGAKRVDMLRDRQAGFYVKEPFRRQYLVLPESVAQSWGGRFVTDLISTVGDLYPAGGGYKPEIITYPDRGPRTYRDQGKAILAALGSRILESAYALVMLHSTTDRKIREHDALAAMVLREMRKRDVFAAVNHSDMGERCYRLVTGRNGSATYEVQSEHRGRLTGYIRNVALNKILLTNGFWPFVLATPLHADVTIGFDVKNQTAAFTVVGKNGSDIHSVFQTSKQREKLAKDQVLTHIAAMIRDVQARLGRPVQSVVIHRDGRCFQSEQDGISAAIDKLKTEGVIARDGTLTVLEISKTAPVRLRLYEVQRTHGTRPNVQNPQVGLYTIINGNEGFLCSTGRAFFHKGTVQPLHVRCIIKGMPFAETLEDVYALTTLTWTRPEDCSRYPITLKLADRWLGEEASEFDQDTLTYETEGNDTEQERRRA
jgi:hypothetical protein